MLGLLWAIVKLLSALALESLKRAIEALERQVERQQTYIDHLEERLRVRRDEVHHLGKMLMRANEHLFRLALLAGQAQPDLEKPIDEDQSEKEA